MAPGASPDGSPVGGRSESNRARLAADGLGAADDTDLDVGTPIDPPASPTLAPDSRECESSLMADESLHFDIDWGSTLEKALYVVGSVIFAVGSFYFEHPSSVDHRISADREAIMLWATTMFVVGSVIFVLAAFLNALSLTSSSSLTFGKWSIATCSLYEFGGILYVIGSVCFMPGFMGCSTTLGATHNSGMEVLGAWCFIVGSVFYVLGTILEFMKTVALLYLKQREEEAAERIKRFWRRAKGRRDSDSSVSPGVRFASEATNVASRAAMRARRQRRVAKPLESCSPDDDEDDVDDPPMFDG
eukprot:CAMPEP_0198608336 /NCGR_PEP_ID=MMETSP1462-20131121/155846_1 /TAXON_ID=1333877 /ORGANISM="Brandtodinium nutriculum, Strain RCC3387" /LENGTH=302 /DNA_ID=CAMNT_0044340143 /DNA_START=398 /DNA_END=1302 /DNA_ORIENTATION=-